MKGSLHNGNTKENRGEPGRLRRGTEQLLPFRRGKPGKKSRPRPAVRPPAPCPPGGGGGGLPAAGGLLRPGLLQYEGHLYQLVLCPAQGAAGLWISAGAPSPAADRLYSGLPPGASCAAEGDLCAAAPPDFRLPVPRYAHRAYGVERSPLGRVDGKRKGFTLRRGAGRNPCPELCLSVHGPGGHHCLCDCRGVCGAGRLRPLHCGCGRLGV